MITGALIFRKRFENELEVRRFYQHNWLRLLVTSEIWIFVMYWIRIVGKFPHLLQLQHVPMLLFGLVKTMLFIDPITFGSIWYIPMILALYLMLPIMVRAVHQFSLRVLALPTILVIISGMIIPGINEFLRLLGVNYHIVFTISFSNIFSVYFPYVIIGYWFSIGGLKRMSDWLLRSSTVVVFTLLVAYQFFAYSTKINYILDYNFFGFLILSALLFELVRREAPKFQRFSKLSKYVSVRSFAIYFIHILVMTVLVKSPFSFSGFRPLQVLYLEVGSILGSLILISIMERNKLVKKYMLYM